LTTLDWLIVGAYVVAVWLVGLLLARRAGRSTEEYFASGRGLPWWIVGTSMAASAFSSDTPHYVAALVREHGVARNWEWWGWGIGGVFVAFVLAPLWRRVGVLTDLELIELRFGGRPAAALRGFRALHTGLLLNVIAMAAPVAGMLLLAEALGLHVDAVSFELRTALILATVLYSFFGGFWGVIVTDFIQFVIAMGAAILVAVLAVDAAGGLQAVWAASPVPLDTVDWSVPESDPWNQGLLPFVVFAGVTWWTYVNADGGGKIVQRMIAARNERHAVWGALWFNITHYALRTWPWVLVGLASFVLVPEIESPQLAYAATAVKVLPPGLLGVFVASFVAAYMSTLDTQLNWGSSYLVNDFYRRFLVRGASESHYVTVARLATVLLAAGTVGIMALEGSNVTRYLRLGISVSMGYGIALLARWFWWRATAGAEIVALLAALLATVWTRLAPPEPFPKILLFVTAVSALAWYLAVRLRRPPDPASLVAFYRRARPPGLWGPVARLAPEVDRERLSGFREGGAALAVVFGATLGLGGLFLGQPLVGLSCLLAAGAGGLGLRHLSRGERSH
jgi:Na+/proline symporter